MLIFKELYHRDVQNCQSVCRSWHNPAHATILKRIDLGSSRKVEQFIAAIDSNPKQLYLKAVEEITITDGTILERDAIEKLFFRFPNLKKVRLWHEDQIQNFNQELCKTMLVRCPKLETFELFPLFVEHPNLLEKVQPLLTEIDLMGKSSSLEGVQPVQFITQFPRLKDVSLEVDRLVDIFPIFEQLSRVTKFSLSVMEDRMQDINFDDLDELEELDDTEINAEEEYLQAKPKEIRDQIMQRLSNIKNLSLRLFYYPINAIKFISNYCTGVESFSLERVFLSSDEGDDEYLFHEHTGNFLNAIKGECFVYLKFQQFLDFTDDFTYFAEYLFKKVESKTIHLAVKTEEIDSPYHFTVHCHFDPSSSVQNVEITAGTKYGCLLAQLFREEECMSNVDVFTIDCGDGEDSQKAQVSNSDAYIKLLEGLPSLKEVELDIPEWYKETEEGEKNCRSDNRVTLDQVHKATFNAATGGNIQSLLDRCSKLFPNLKTLDMNEYNGEWKPHLGEFQLDLQDYSLESLTLNIGPAMLKTHKFLEKKVGFFVVEVEILDSGTRCLCKLPLDPTSAEIVTTAALIKDKDLNGLKRGKDYLRIHININNLKQLEFSHILLRKRIIIYPGKINI